MITPDKYLDWAVAQLKAAGISQHVEDSVMVLLTVFYSQEHDVTERGQVLDLFDSLAHLHAVVVHSNGTEVWAPARLGAVSVGDNVRVRRNAFNDDNPQAIYHNGRRGVIIAIRRGDIYVGYRDGREPPSPDTGLRFPAGMLEKRMR